MMPTQRSNIRFDSQPRRRGQTSLLVLLVLASGFVALAASRPTTLIRAELRSWVVAGRGRHLYLQIDAQPPYEHLSGRVEFTSAALRRDYDPLDDRSGQPRLARMTRGTILEPFFDQDPADRLERVVFLTPREAECLQRDLVFESPYVLLTTNSNAAMRRALESCGCAIPRRVADSGGALGEFPGIGREPGPPLDASLWASFGVGAADRAGH